MPDHGVQFKRIRAGLLQTRGNGNFGHGSPLVPSWLWAVRIVPPDLAKLEELVLGMPSV